MRGGPGRSGIEGNFGEYIVAGDEQHARITLDGVATSHPYALMLPQSETERLLEGHPGRPAYRWSEA